MSYKINCDIDNVLNFFSYHFADWVIEEYGIPYNMNALKNYDIEQGIDVEKTIQKKVIMEQIFKTKDFWLTLPTVDNAQIGLQWLVETYPETYIVTTPWKFSKNYMDWKIEWIEKEFPFFPKDHIIFSKNKWELDGDIIIDDNPTILKNCQSNGFISIAYCQPYNIKTPVDYFLMDWQEIEYLLKTIRGKDI